MHLPLLSHPPAIVEINNVLWARKCEKKGLIMTYPDPATRAKSKERAAFRYEAARQQLSETLYQRASTDTRLAIPVTDRAVTYKRAIDRASKLLVPLSRFIKSELRRVRDDGRLEYSAIDADDVLMSSIIEAEAQLDAQVATAGTYPWLRKIALEKLHQTIEAEAERASMEKSLEMPIERGGQDWPDNVLLLREVLADANAVLPDVVVERDETWRILEHALGELPERWREVFLLRSVDAWDDDEIARAEGIDVAEVEVINTAARAFLRESLRESEWFEEE
jgi:DNA-directed RNA polymerase specialized sigma24 family protein